jgi:hypothetical protein
VIIVSSGHGNTPGVAISRFHYGIFKYHKLFPMFTVYVPESSRKNLATAMFFFNGNFFIHGLSRLPIGSTARITET